MSVNEDRKGLPKTQTAPNSHPNDGGPREIAFSAEASYPAPIQGPLITYSAAGIAFDARDADPAYLTTVLRWETVMAMAKQFHKEEKS